MALFFSGRPSATGTLSFVIDSMQMPFGRQVGWCLGTTLLGNIEVLNDWGLGAMLLSLRLHFCL